MINSRIRQLTDYSAKNYSANLRITPDYKSMIKTDNLFGIWDLFIGIFFSVEPDFMSKNILIFS
jgi:hypothetical protein